MNRRNFLQAAAVFVCAPSLRAAEYDLVIHGGRVIDPGRKIDGLLDIAVRGGKIVAVHPGIATSSAAESIDATGKLVVPGLVDIHLHARDAQLPPPEILSTGVTTMVDAGSRGADNVDQLVEIARTAPNRMRILLNIARLGNNPGGRGEFLDSLEPADVAKARAAIQKHRQWIVGIKARLSRGVSAQRDLEVLRRAVQAAGPLPIMIHIGDTNSLLPQILALLRKGDIVTHMYAPTPNGILDANGQVLPQVRQARRRGIRFDFGNGLNEHWSWDVAEAGLKQGFPPDTITSDLVYQARADQVFDLPTVLSKFLYMGMPLTQVLACATSSAAATFRSLNPYGSLRPGSAADIAVLELTQGNFTFVDNYKGKRLGTQKLVTKTVIAAGKRVA